MVDAYLDTLDIEPPHMERIQKYLDLIRRRSDGQPFFQSLYMITDWKTGRLLTAATWIRNFVTSHPDYKNDSVVSQIINYDLLVAVDEM